ncbi:MAG: hypothetical protein M1825_005739 [Sarcosagium campestre]|nr:MAG: hypothetical protein M1825_005739 [Sarcosagium campestre]
MLAINLSSTRLQTVTYLLGVCLFSISFLVFLNSSISFVVVDIIGIEDGVGDAVGTLGFVDELVALAACPIWGLLSDRIGVRTVCVIGYAIVGLSLFLFVQARNVYPQLLLARILFSLGGAATSTMVTAILPAMTTPAVPSPEDETDASPVPGHAGPNRYSIAGSNSSEQTITPARHAQRISSKSSVSTAKTRDGAPLTSRLAGIVGFCTGCGALVALALFLPLSTWFARLDGVSAAQALTDSYYVVGGIALLVSVFCFFGLRGLNGDETKGWRAMLGYAVNVSENVVSENGEAQHPKAASPPRPSYVRNFVDSVVLGRRDSRIGLAYLGGFVARASSVGISLFIPLYVNAYFISRGTCSGGDGPKVGTPGDVKRQCERAYKLAAALTGVSQLVALVFAPVFGYLADRYRAWRFEMPLLLGAAVGVVGYIAFARLSSPEPVASASHGGGPAVFIIVSLLGISQIGAIVCSLGLLSRGVVANEGGRDDSTLTSTPVQPQYEQDDGHSADETTALLSSSSSSPSRDGTQSHNNDQHHHHYQNHNDDPDGNNDATNASRQVRQQPYQDQQTTTNPTSNPQAVPSSSRSSTTPPPPPPAPQDASHDIQTKTSPRPTNLKGSIAGIYSLSGGAGILLLTKLGGYLFDSVSSSAPFYMLAAFNALLLFVGLIVGVFASRDE